MVPWRRAGKGDGVAGKACGFFFFVCLFLLFFLRPVFLCWWSRRPCCKGDQSAKTCRGSRESQAHVRQNKPSRQGEQHRSFEAEVCPAHVMDKEAEQGSWGSRRAQKAEGHWELLEVWGTTFSFVFMSSLWLRCLAAHSKKLVFLDLLCGTGKLGACFC